ncbi:hypothetical protein KIPB_006671, partial [Kipferlia bialata]|eukprot:g6671.t1
MERTPTVQHRSSQRLSGGTLSHTGSVRSGLPSGPKTKKSRKQAPNPFVPPADNEVFRVRDSERWKGKQERERFNRLSIQEKAEE